MSYDLYCYRPSSDVPSAAEAEALIEALESAEEAGDVKVTSSGTKEKIAAALLQHNPRLETTNFDYHAIAESQKISEDEARARYQDIELNSPEGDLAIQLTVCDDHVYVSIPYWYGGEGAEKVFSQCSEYLRIIRRTAGFFVYDQQTGSAFDPERSDFRNQPGYEKTVTDMAQIGAGAERKPWWKFW